MKFGCFGDTKLKDKDIKYEDKEDEYDNLYLAQICAQIWTNWTYLSFGPLLSP